MWSVPDKAEAAQVLTPEVRKGREAAAIRVASPDKTPVRGGAEQGLGARVVRDRLAVPVEEDRVRREAARRIVDNNDEQPCLGPHSEYIIGIS